MRILVDADACPVKRIVVRLAKTKQVPVIMVADTSHDLEDGYSEIVIVDKARDSADIKLANLLQKGDVVITQDYGVAAMALGKGAAALDQNGRIYNEENMDRLLFERYLGQKNRCVGGASHRAMGMKGPKRRTAEEDASFEKSLCRLLEIPTKE